MGLPREAGGVPISGGVHCFLFTDYFQFLLLPSWHCFANECSLLVLFVYRHQLSQHHLTLLGMQGQAGYVVSSAQAGGFSCCTARKQAAF